MPRQSIIKVTATFEIAYDRKEFGATGKAEAAATELEKTLSETAGKHGAKVTAFVPIHTSREA